MFISRFNSLAIKASLLSLLMVVCWPVDFGAVAFALPAGSQQGIVTTYRLFHRCSHNYLHIYGGKKKSKTAPAGDYDILVTKSSPSLKSNDFNSTIQIQGKRTNAYLCFDKNGRLITRFKFSESHCTFHEELDENHYTQLRQRNWKVGFTKRGRPLIGNTVDINPQCFQFMKQNVTNHVVQQQHVGSVQEVNSQQQKQQPHRKRHGQHQKKSPHPHRQHRGQKKHVKPSR